MLNLTIKIIWFKPHCLLHFGLHCLSLSLMRSKDAIEVAFWWWSASLNSYLHASLPILEELLALLSIYRRILPKFRQGSLLASMLEDILRNFSAQSHFSTEQQLLHLQLQRLDLKSLLLQDQCSLHKNRCQQSLPLHRGPCLTKSRALEKWYAIRHRSG